MQNQQLYSRKSGEKYQLSVNSAHCGNKKGNEEADQLAKKGTLAQQTECSLIQSPKLITKGHTNNIVKS